MPFRPGVSGNPGGKKPGTPNKRLALLRSYDKRLQKKVVTMALQGDTACLKLCADRLWPRLRSEAAPVQLTTGSSNLEDRGALIVDAALAGTISPDVARDLLSALADVARLKEFTEHEERLAALEAKDDAPPWLKQSLPEREVLPIRGRKRKRETEN